MKACAIDEPLKPRIYVACLAAYNNAILHGAWIDADQEAWTLFDEITAMLAASPIAEAEEWAIHDYEGFGVVRIEEFTGLERVAELASFVTEHGQLGAALLDHFGNDLDEARAAISDRYHGAHASLADYMQDMTEECVAIPTPLRSYIDWQAMARDAELGGDVFTITTPLMSSMSSPGADMDDQPATHRLVWQGIEIEVRYWPLRWGVTAHLGIQRVKPERARLPITETG